MPRFHMLDHLLSHNREFQDFFASLTGGTSGHDHLNGTESSNMLFAGRGDDDVTGMAGNDMLDGGNGNDMMWGGSGNDRLSGGSGNDMLTGGFGADHLNGGTGNDVLLSRSDAGEMVAAQDGTTQIFADETAAFTSHDDVLTGGKGADTFRFEGLVNAKDEIVAKHVNADGTIDWHGVTGENNNVHDHWVDGFGNDTITDFNRAQGDKIEIAAHTAEVKSIEYLDTNHDGKNDTSVITVISQQGNAGAHDEDLLGTITVHGDLVKQSDIKVDNMAVYGAYEKVGQLPAGTHFQIEDDGVLPNGATDGGHHDEAAMAMNVAMANHM
ncbi:calcium-binding protein [Bradyrhizobium sp. STM 3557]|uniref:calcium-binding protein n=1 Tax=Bradyrhizobium sp. STM 3557 TaxID=578920 RepID=UPI00388D4946